ncbi:hypothetical protein VPH35_031019 [Triticum aestivum]
MVNIDAAVFSQSQRLGIGIVIRNHMGVEVNPELAEAIAMRCAMEFAEEAGFQSIVVASDCEILVTKVKNVAMDRSRIGAITFDIKSRASKFVSCLFTHINRPCNEAAHVLARSFEHDCGSCWFNVVPGVIRTIICNEKSLIE